MSKSITIEEAVSRMVNFENIPDGMTLLEALETCALKAEDDLADAKADKVPTDQMYLHEFRVKACNARYELAGYLKQLMEWEIDTKGISSCLKLSPDSSSITRLEIDSVAEWAYENYEIGRFDFEEVKSEHKELMNELEGELPKTKANEAASKIAEEGLKKHPAKRLYITFAYLLGNYFKAKYGDVETIDSANVSKLAADLSTAASTLEGDRTGYGYESMRDRINIALAMKKGVIKN